MAEAGEVFGHAHERYTHQDRLEQKCEETFLPSIPKYRWEPSAIIAEKAGTGRWIATSGSQMSRQVAAPARDERMSLPFQRKTRIPFQNPVG